MIPVVLGISFEVLQLTNSLRNVPVLKYLGYPGLWLQLLTTKDPDDKQVEVAIASFEKLLEIEEHGVEVLECCKAERKHRNTETVPVTVNKNGRLPINGCFRFFI